MRVRFGRLAVALILVGFAASPAFAQGSSTKGAVTGVVQDRSGGVVPGATVVIKNVANGIVNETTSNISGAFAVPALDAGTYEATVSLTGFKTVKIDKIVLTPGNTANVSATLDVGDASDTVLVVARTELIDTTSTTVSSTITSDQMQKLPLVTKNGMQFLAFLPGVNTPPGNHVQRNSTVMGLPQSAIAIVIDGVNVQDQSIKSTDGFYAVIRPQTDMVEQVTVSEATATADSSGQGAVQIKFVTRSGGNRNTGSSYEYYRDTWLNSNSWSNISRGLPKQQVSWNQFGLRQGGPIRIPGIFDGTGRAFYFINYEEFRLPVTALTTRTVLSLDAQSGVFKYGCSAAGGCTGSVNLLQVAAANGQVSTIDPTIATMFSRINTAVASQGTVQSNVDLNTFRYSWQPPLFRAEHLPGGRLDVNLNQSNRLSGTSNYQRANSDPDIINNGYPSFPDLPVRSTQYSFRYTATATLRSTLTKNLVNEAGWGLISSPVYFSANLTAADFLGGRNFGFLAVGGSTPQQYNVNNGNVTSRNGANYNFHDTVNWQKGSHSFSTGAVYTMVWQWNRSVSLVPGATLGLDTTNDPANGMFNPTNFPGSQSADLNSARNLYAILTGRVTAINANSILQPDGTYLYRGDSFQRVQQPELGMFFQDQWRLRPNFTVNAGLRYELQYPIEPVQSVFARNDIADLCGRAGLGAAAPDAPLATIGCQFGVPGVPLNGPAPTYKLYEAGTPGYHLDTNNVGPSIGAAWQPNVKSGFLRPILGDPAFATVRASFGRAYNQGGLSDYTGTIGNGPGLTVATNRTVGNSNLVLPADAATYGGTGWPLLLRQSERFGPPDKCTAGQTLGGCIPTSATFPQPIVFNTGIAAFDPNYQTSYTDSWSFGFQRSLSRNMSVEIRFIGNKANALAGNVNYNEINIYSAGFGSSANFIDEFKLAQKNLAANVAAGKGATFAYTGIPGTAPLPIFLASYNGVGAPSAADPTKYTGAQWTNTATVPALSFLSPSIGTFASTNSTTGLFGNPTFRANGQAAGMPVNFWVMNPDVATANLRTAEGFTKYHTIQLLVNRRLSRGMAFSFNYAYQVGYTASLDTLFRERALVRSTSAPPHAFKLTVNYDAPFGRGKRFLSDVNGWVNGLIGNWTVNLTGRVETGRLVDIGDVKLVNLTLADLQHQFKFYLGADGNMYDLPQDLIANTVKAFAIDVTSPTGHPLCTGSNATTCGGPDPTKPYLAPASDENCTRIIAGDCGPRQRTLNAPLFTRFDFSAKKAFSFAKRSTFDFEVDLLNIFNAIDFNSVFSTSTNPDNYRVTGAYSDINNTYDPGGRIGQLVFRLNW